MIFKCDALGEEETISQAGENWDSYVESRFNYRGLNIEIIDDESTAYYSPSQLWTGYYDVDTEYMDNNTLYAVVVHYSSGDTFGNTDNLIEIVDLFATREMADALASACRKADAFSFNIYGKDYLVCWNGYFDSFQDVEIEEINIEQLLKEKTKQ